VVCFKPISHHFPGRTAANNKKLESEQWVSESRFKPGVSGARDENHSAAKFDRIIKKPNFKTTIETTLEESSGTFVTRQ
jgi:hypothetical protein